MWAPGLLTWRTCVAQCSPSVRRGSVCLAGCLKCAAKVSISVLLLSIGSYRYWEERVIDSSWNMMAHGDAREGKWRGDWRIQWVASTLHTTSEHGVSSITTADAHTSAASSRLNWRPCRFKWTSPFCRKTELVSARVPSHFNSPLPREQPLLAAEVTAERGGLGTAERGG